MSKIIPIEAYKKSQGYLERPYGECGCGLEGSDMFNIVLSDWSDNADVFALRCCGCGESVELEPSIVITCELE